MQQVQRKAALMSDSMHAEPNRASHVSAEQLAAHLERRLRGGERSAVVAHLAECSECRAEFAAAGQLVPRWQSVRWPFIAGGLIAAAASIVLVSSPTRVASELPLSGGVTERVAQPEAAPPVVVTAPLDGERLTGPRVQLTWQSHGPNTLYRVTVQSSEGRVLWRSDTNDTTITVSADTKLATGEIYYWFVEALQADGRSSRSRATAFRR
jgi:hypothetical protein